MDALSRKLLNRLPLAEATLLLLSWIFSDWVLEGLWNTHRRRCYQKKITFPVLFRLILGAVVTHKSGRAKFEEAIENDGLNASIQAAFKKLSRVPIELSVAILESSAKAIFKLFPQWAMWEGPKSLRKYQVVTLDGKVVKHVEKRLKPLRGTRGGLLGGRGLVALDWSTGMVLSMVATPDGDANEIAFVEELVNKVEPRPKSTILWLGDRAFCTLVQIASLAQKGNSFVIRYKKNVIFTRDSQKPIVKGIDEQGRKYSESWGWLGAVNNPSRRYVRRIELQLDNESLVIVTNILDREECPAEDLLWLYGERWGIERVFEDITTTFNFKHLIGGTPEATIFQFVICMVLYNILQVIRAQISKCNNRSPDEVSSQKVQEDIRDQMVAWALTIDAEDTESYFGQSKTVEDVTTRLEQILDKPWKRRWAKSPPGKKRIHEKKRGTWTHGSVHRIINAYKAEMVTH